MASGNHETRGNTAKFFLPPFLCGLPFPLPAMVLTLSKVEMGKHNQEICPKISSLPREADSLSSPVTHLSLFPQVALSHPDLQARTVSY